MSNLTKIASTLLLSAVTVTLITGCNQKRVKHVKQYSQQRSQQLVIRTTAHQAQEKIVQDFLSLNLDNQSRNTGTISLENKGGQELKILSVKSNSKTSDLFERSTECDNVTIQPGEKCDMQISFVGKKAGRFQQVLTVKSDDKRNKTTLIKVNASALDITSARIDPRTAPRKYSPNTKLDFNVLNRSQYVEISQTGDKILNIKEFRLSGKNSNSFDYTTTCPKVLKVGGKCSMTINYDPSKQDGLSEAYIKIIADGAIAPTSKVELKGRTEAYSVDILEYKVSKNVTEFMDDYFSTNSRYYYRTMFQSDSDSELETLIDAQLKDFFRENNLFKAAKANSANKIINIFPRIEITDLVDESNNVIGMTINMGINGTLVTKSNYNNSFKLKNNGHAVLSQDTNSTTFVSMDTEKEFVDKEDFSYFLKLKVTNYEDRNLALDRVAELMAQKLFNILGMNDQKGK